MANNHLSRLADKLVSDGDRFKKLQEFGNRKNYPNKIEQLRKKIEEQHNFWSLKNSSRKLDDITKDLIFIKSVKDPSLNKERIDVLIEKYGLK